jgi:hypothetical protein
MAMQGAIILASENKQLRVANERQVKKRQVTRKFISKETVLTVADAQRLVTTNIEVERPLDDKEDDIYSEIVVHTLSPRSRPRGNRPQLLSCYMYNGYNYSTDECTKTGQSSI